MRKGSSNMGFFNRNKRVVGPQYTELDKWYGKIDLRDFDFTRGRASTDEYISWGWSYPRAGSCNITIVRKSGEKPIFAGSFTKDGVNRGSLVFENWRDTFVVRADRLPNKEFGMSEHSLPAFAEALSLALAEVQGIAGEQRLAKMVQSLGFYNAGWESFWPLRASDAGDTDVDCVLVHGRDVYLIDAKNYSVNKNLYLTLANNYKQLLVVDSAGEVQYFKGGKDKYSMWRTYEISHNMSMAVDYYQRALPSWANIHAVVALCPTKDGIPGIKNRVEYPGAIPLVQSNAYLLELCKRHPDYAKADAAILSKLNELLKG